MFWNIFKPRITDEQIKRVIDPLLAEMDVGILRKEECCGGLDLSLKLDITVGGEELLGLYHSEETKKKMSKV